MLIYAKNGQNRSKIGQKIFLIKGVGGLILLYYIYNIISLSYIRAREEGKIGLFFGKNRAKNHKFAYKVVYKCTNVQNCGIG